jgi:hypothetical protein
MSFLSELAKVFGKVADNVQGRIERLKNERDALIQERQELYDGDSTPKAQKRILAINDRIAYIDGVLSNNARD